MPLNLMNLSVIGVTFIIAICGTMLFKKAAGTLDPTKINPISGAYYFLLILSLFGMALFVMGADHHTIRYMRHQDIKVIAWLTTMILFVVFPAVIIICNKIFRLDPDKNEEYHHKEVMVDRGSNAEFITMVIATIVVIGAVVYTYAKIGVHNSPIVNMILRKPPEELAKLRMVADINFPGNSYIKNIFAIALTPFISFIAYGYMRKTKEKKWIIMFVILFIASNLMAFYNLQKAPIIVYWGSFVILSVYFGDKIKARHLIILGLVTVVAIIAMYVLIVKSPLSKIFSWNGPINRILLTTPSAYILHLEVFSFRTPFLNGASLANPFGKLILGQQEVIRSGRVIMELINFKGVAQGTAGVYNGLFLGEAFANFGKWGIMIAMIHVPAVFFAVNAIFMKIKKNPITIALFTYWTVNLLMTINGGYFDYIFSMVWTLVTLTGVAMIYFIKILKKFNI